MHIARHPKKALIGLGIALLVSAIVGMNLAILYSSVPDYEQMGWALFCGTNALWIAVLGVGCFIFADSTTVALRQLDYDRERETA